MLYIIYKMSIHNLFYPNDYVLRCASITCNTVNSNDNFVKGAISSIEVIGADTNITADNIKNSLIYLSGTPVVNTTLLFPTVASILNSYTVKPQVGSILDILISNNITDLKTATVDISAATGMSLLASNVVIPANSQRVIRLIFTNVTTGSESATCLM